MTTDPVPVRHLVLLGLMGSGKTTVGTLVAERLGWPLIDSDADIAAREGRTVRELHDEIGVDAMHDTEARHLLGALAAPRSSVICAAASTVDDERCLVALRDPSLVLVWLTASPEVAAGRFDAEPHRPRFGDDAAAFLADQAGKRGPRFRAIGALELLTDDRRPDELTDELVALLASRRTG